MTNNSALYLGGAIYIYNTIMNHYGLPECALQIDSSSNLNITLTNNTAEVGGNDIYAYPIYECYNLNNNNIITKTKEYSKHFTMKENMSNNRFSISTEANNFSICNSQSLFAGKIGSMCVLALDQANNTVYSMLQFSVRHNQPMRVKPKFDIIVNESRNRTCTKLNITISLLDDQYTSLPTHVYVILSTPTSSVIFNLILKISKCPPGFDIVNGICQCSKTVKQFYKSVDFSNGNCDINELTIAKPPMTAPWMGTIDNRFVIAKECPITFCNNIAATSKFQYKNISINNDLIINDRNVQICRQHRKGVMCSECLEGYSVVFGSDECKKCSDWSLWLIVAQIILTPLTIFMMYILKASVTTGTINGLIFFSQVSNVGLIQWMRSVETHSEQKSFILILVSILKLSIEHPLCFFNGMNEITKRSLYLLSSLYFLIISGIIIILSKYSSWFSHRVSQYSVQILVTVVHLSVSFLLLSVIEVAIPVKIYTGNDTYYVWNRGGSYRYFSGPHLILFGSTVLAAGIVLVPYLMILSFGKRFMRCSARCNINIRPFLEAVEAPYRETQQFWFVGRLFFIIALYIIYALYQITNTNTATVYLCIAVMLFFLLIGQTFLHPLKSKVLNVIDSVIVMNSAICYFLLFLFHEDERFYKNETMNGVFYTCLYIILIFFVGIFVYHVAMVTGQLEKIKTNAVKMKNVFLNIKCFKRLTLNQTQDTNIGRIPLYGSCDDYREPLIN